MFHHQSNTSTAPSDEQLDYFANQYHACPKLRTRVTFSEFLTQPEYYLKHVDTWPEREWSIDFAPYGSHQKMWVNNCLDGTTISVQKIRLNEYQSIIGKLDDIAKVNGRPNGALIDPTGGYSSDTARAWCRINGVLVLRPRKDNPQLIDSFGAEVAA